jgi:hypothetical protein
MTFFMTGFCLLLGLFDRLVQISLQASICYMRDCQIGLQHGIFLAETDKLKHLYNFHAWIREELHRYPDSPKMNRDSLFNYDSIWYISHKLREIQNQYRRMETFKQDMTTICKNWIFKYEIACLLHLRKNGVYEEISQDTQNSSNHDNKNDVQILYDNGIPDDTSKDQDGAVEMFVNMEYDEEFTFM